MRKRIGALVLALCMSVSLMSGAWTVKAAEAAETTAMETEAMETEAMETEAMETEAMETEAMETEALETEAMETEAMETEAMETEAMETEAMEEMAETETMITAPEDLMAGDVIEGFEVLEVREFPLIGGVIVFLEHQQTGAQMMYIANDDTNRVFDLTFFTKSIDNTGLPHVFEHSTLDGSEKYPSKSLFFNLSYQTYQTYMNAATYDCMTTYPVASLSEAQLLKLADYYTDSCLHPMIMEDESIFREEAWRYRMADADAPLTIEGTVYSEMLGAIDLETQAYLNYARATFPGSYLGFESGGEPAHIPEMTWDSLKNYHNLFYHPSNCICYLYGDIEDYPAFLALLNEAFADYEKREFTFEDADYEPLTEPAESSLPFPVEEGSNTKNASTIYYSFVCKDVAEEDLLKLDTLTDLLGATSSPLQQSLKKAIPSGVFSCFIEEAGPEPAVVFSASHVNPEDADTFKETVNAVIAQVAAEGFAPEMAEAEMAQLSISTRLMREASDVGVESVIPALAYGYASTGNPWYYLDYVDALNQMDAWNEAGVYAEVAGKYLDGSQTTALAVTYPEPGLKEANDQAEAERLAEVKAAMSDEEIEAIVASSNAVEEPEDNAAMVAELQAVTVESLPEEIRNYEYTDETDEMGVRHIDVLAGVDGVGQVDIYLDAAGLTADQLHWYKLYTDLTGYLDTRSLTRDEIDVLSTRYLYGGGIAADQTGHVDDYHPYLHFGWIGTDEELAAGYDLMYAMIYDLDVEDGAKLADAVSAIRANLKAAINESPYSVQLYRSYGRFWPLYQYMSYLNYLEYYDFLNNLEMLLEEDPTVAEAASEQLLAIQDYFNNSTGAVITFCGNEESIANNRAIADTFFGNLGQNEIEAAEYDLPVAENSEALIVESSVQYNGIVASYDALGLPGFSGALDAVSSLVLDLYLMPLLRDQYGAYGVFHSAGFESGMYLISYRDPNVEETFEVYQSLPELVAETEIDQETLDGYILAAYNYYALSDGELSGAVKTAGDVLDGKDPNAYLTYMEQLKSLTADEVQDYAEMYTNMLANGSMFTSGSAAAIAENEYLYDAVLNPFGAANLTEVEFEDVAEDDEMYEAVRFAFENGLMAAADETTFGKDEEATCGDLAIALYVLAIGDGPTVEDAVETLAMYGIVPEDTDPEAALSGEAAVASLGGLNEALGLPADYGIPEVPEAMTRGDLAQMLLDYYNALSAE